MTGQELFELFQTAREGAGFREPGYWDGVADPLQEAWMLLAHKLQERDDALLLELAEAYDLTLKLQHSLKEQGASLATQAQTIATQLATIEIQISQITALDNTVAFLKHGGQ